MITLLSCVLLNLGAVHAPEKLPSEIAIGDTLVTCALVQSKSLPQESVPVDAMPKLLTRADPVYPREARERGIEGKVYVQLVVNPDGRVAEATVLKSDAEILNQAALDAARKYTFAPVPKEYATIPRKVVIPFQFRLSGKGGEGTHAPMYAILGEVERLLHGRIDSSSMAVVNPGATVILRNTLVNLRSELLSGSTLREEGGRTVYKQLQSDEGAPSATVVLITEGKTKRYHTVTLVRGDDQRWQIRLWHLSE